MEPVRRDPISNTMSNPIENPIGNRIGNQISNRIGNPIGNPIGHPRMLLAPFGLQLGRVRIQDLPKRYSKGNQEHSKNLPGTPPQNLTKTHVKLVAPMIQNECPKAA